MSTYNEDREKSDTFYDEKLLSYLVSKREILSEKGVVLSSDQFRKSTQEEDQTYAIDYWNGDDGFQMRVTFAPGKIPENMVYPTMRLGRPNSLSTKQKKSEYHKIKENIKTKQQYPKWLVWVYADRKTYEIIRLFIIDIKKIYSYKHCIGPITKDYLRNKKDYVYLQKCYNSESTNGNSTFIVISLDPTHYPDNIKHDNFCVYEEYRNI